MKIFFVGSYKKKPTTGGHLYNAKIIESLEHAEHQVKIVSVFQMPGLFRTKPLSFLYAFFLLFLGIPDLVIQMADSAPRYFLFSLLTRLLAIPAVQVVYHIDNSRPGSDLRQKLILFFMKFNLRQAGWIVVISNHTKSEVLRLVTPHLKTKVAIIRPGLEIKSPVKAGHNYNNKKLWTLLSTGVITERKGYYYLIEALAGLKEYSFKSYIVGAVQDRKYYDSLLDLIRKLKLEGKVTITGYLSKEELQALYPKSDIFIHPSLLEGYGIVLCEALFYGLPVVATSVGAIPEIISDQYNGLLVEPRDAKAIKDALMMLMSDPALAERLSKNAIASSKHLNSWDGMQQDFQRLIRTIESGKA